jgi:hypothetical protein
MKELRREAPPPPDPQGPGRLSPDQPVWEMGGDRLGSGEGRPRPPEPPRQPERAGQLQRVQQPEPAGRRERAGRWGPGRFLLAVALALGVFAGGIALGSVLAGRSTRTSPAPATSAIATTAIATTAAPATTTAPARQVAPRVCLSAVDDADAVISYLVAGVRDQRLARTMQQYRAASGSCRRAR